MLLASLILLPVFGFFWIYVAGALVGILCAYAVSTAFGYWAHQVHLGQFLIRSILAGVAIAVTTLLLAALMLGTSIFVVETTRDLLSAPSGQPFGNAVSEFAPINATQFIAVPVAAAMLYGIVPATVLGFIYGMLLHIKTDSDIDSRRAVSTWLVGGLAGAIIVVGTLAALSFTVLTGNWRSQVPIVPFAIGGCGSTRMASGVLAYCFGHPCEGNNCDWGNRQIVFVSYIEPATDGRWDWTGGGLGTTRRRDIVQHNMYWAQTAPGEYFDESDPYRYVKYQMHFKDGQVEIGGYRFQFEPGMLIVIRFADDWSFEVDVGSQAMNATGSSLAELRKTLNASCQESKDCGAPFAINSGPIE